MPTVGKIRVNLEGDSRQFQRTMRGAERQVQGFGRQIRRMQRSIASVAGVLGFGLLIRRTGEEAVRAQQLSQRLGTTVDSFSRLSRVMGRSGIGMNQTATMLQRMLRRAAEARDGNENLSEAFEELGIDVERFVELDPVEAFIQLGVALSGVENNADKVRAAFRILDSEGVQALQANLKNLREELDKTSGISDEQAESITKLSEQWDKLKEAMSTAFLTVGQESGAIAALTRAFAAITQFAQNPEEMQSRAREAVKLNLGRQFLAVWRAMMGATETAPNPPPISAPMTGTIGGGRVFVGGLERTNAILERIERNTSEPAGAVAQ